MSAVKKRSRRAGFRSTAEFRELAVTNALSGQHSIPELAGIYGIGQSTLYRWAADSRQKVQFSGKKSVGRSDADQIELVRREREAFKIVAIALARELARG